MPETKPIAITCGDPAGVGPEVIAAWLRQQSATDVICLGPADWLDAIGHPSGLAIGVTGFRLKPGQPTEDGARIAVDALREAAMGCREGRYRAVVTGPVSKEWMQRVGWNYPGQTEFFADLWHGQPSMAFAGGRLTVVLTTWHIPLERVAAELNEAALQRAVTNADFLARRLGALQPRIGVCGLNPHAGEGGLLGYEEQGILDPILERLRRKHPGLSPCLPGDTLFWRQLQGEFDVVIAMYHDQGLAPLKAVDFDQAVNITLGLPFVRTSPDHGTAFGIAGQGRASHTSFANAVTLARKLSFT